MSLERKINEPLELEVFAHAVKGIAEEMGATLIRTARSINIRERLDSSCAIFDCTGRLLVQAEHHPAHLGALVTMSTAVLGRYPLESLREGDLFIGNDPYEGGGSHLPDVTVAAPAFVEGKLIGLVACMGHWPDVGGKAPGASLEGSTEIFQEGLRIVPIRIADAGKLNENLLDLLVANTRTPQTNRLDFQAQAACLTMGIRGLQEIVRRYSPERYARLCEDLITYSTIALENAVAEIPEAELTAEEHLDNDGVSDKPVNLMVTVRIVHKPKPHITFDFTGTDPQCVGSTNMVRAGLLATLSYVVKTLVDPGLLVSDGIFSVFSMKAPEGSVVNARPPAAVGGKGPVGNRVLEACYLALSNLLPERVVCGSAGNTAFFFAWNDPISHRHHIHLEGVAGGMGARATKDGPDAVQVHGNNIPNMPIEISEAVLPVRVERYELVPDSGGPGQFRGGLSSVKEYRMLADLLFVPHGDRHIFRPWGLFEGQEGSPGRFSYFRNGEETRLPSKGEGIPLRTGDLLRIQTPGGGGYGSPKERDRAAVLKDVREGKIGAAAAQELYGIDLEGGE